MNRYEFSSLAAMDMFEIWEYIARDNISMADQVTNDLLDAVERLGDMPEIGHTREDVADKSLRFWTVFTYIIVYRALNDRIEVVRVLSGYRNISELLH